MPGKAFDCKKLVPLILTGSLPQQVDEKTEVTEPT